ncbi:hypothetical protein OK016_18030 [Vibrio chagasii]|nr:hypothetical protein [Vibrio chagasii]
MVGHGSGSTLSYGYKGQGMMTDYNPYILHDIIKDGYHSEFYVKSGIHIVGLTTLNLLCLNMYNQ